jgi:hypothetical protein
MTELFMTPEQGERLLSQKPQRRRRRSKAEMEQVRLSESIKTPNPVSNADIATTVSTEAPATDLRNELGTVTLHNDHARLPAQEDGKYRDADAWMPEAIAYGAGKYCKGQQLTREDQRALEYIASTYGKGVLPFVYWHAKMTREFTALLHAVQAMGELRTADDFDAAHYDLEEALSLVKEYPFLCTQVNLVLLDEVLFQAQFNHRRIVIWRNSMTRIHGFNFADLDSQRYPQGDDRHVVTFTS